MQNKGFVKVIAVLLTLICLFYLSFSFVTNKYEKKAEELTAQGKDGAAYLDSMRNEKVYLNWKTLKECEELQIGLGLDLKGGMNVVLEVSVPDVVKNLAGESANDPKFKKAYQDAQVKAKKENADFVDAFISTYEQQNGQNQLGGIFASKLKEKNISYTSSDNDVKKVLNEEVAAAVENSNKVVRSRIDRFGVAQPNIQVLHGKGQIGQIMVEMPGIKEPERVRKLLQGSANLEFWETYTLNEAYPSLQALDSRLAKGDAPADTTAADTAKAEQAPAKKGVAEQHPLLAKLVQVQGMAPTGCVVGYAVAADTAAINAMVQSEAAKAVLPADLRLAWGVKSAEGMKGNVFELYALRAVNGLPSMAGDVIADAKDDFDQNHQPIVSMTMTTNGARDWAALTKKNLKKCVAIVLDGYVYSAPVVQSEITGGNSQISGHFTTDDTRDLANVLKSGKMPAPAKIVSEEIVGPSLGAESIQQGVWSCVIAFVILMLYMVTMYGVIPGMVANAALVLNLFFTVGILTSFQAALTMSGIAGMVLTLGMAVDANVLIYERTKEEMRAGKPVREALEAGYNNAFSAIFDSNLTSLITAVILYNFGTGPIRGFATTLFIGICVSFFTAVFLTRVLYTEMMNRDKWKNLTFQTAIGNKISFQNPTFRIMSAYRKSFTVFGVLAVLSLGFMFTRGFSKSIDFTGGRNFVVLFEKQVEPETVRELLAEAFPESNTSAIALGTDGKTIRISTNYRINEDGTAVDSEIEQKLFTVLKDGKLLADDLTLENFINRDERAGGSIISSQKVGPSVAEDITYGAIISVILALAAIFVYILVRFRNVAFSVGSIVALTSDTLLILGMYSMCWGWMPFSLEIDQTFIGAVLTAIGYSINDKVVVFDRIREYIGLYPTHDRKELFNTSLNNTLNRTINTSVSTFIVLAVIFCLGGASIRSFAFAMILGVIFGTLSSIFVAAPTAYLTMRKISKK